MVEKNTFSVILYIKRGKLLKNGEAPIYLRITVKGERFDLSSNMSVLPAHWDSSKGKVKTGATDALDLNNYLLNLKYKIQEHKRQLAEKGIAITCQNLRDAYLGLSEENRGVMEIFEEHNKKCEMLSGKDFAPGTVERYQTARKHLGQYIRHQYKRSDMPITAIDHRFIKDFEYFLKTVRGCGHNTTLKYLINFKKIILLAFANEWIKTNPFKNIKFRYEQVDAQYLDKAELERIITKKFEISRIGRVRDTFIFCCFTGLAFCDVKSLSPENIVKDNYGREWIKKKRQKTNKLCSIPLLETPRAIIMKYQNDPICLKTGKLLPVTSNQKMNAYLKEIADLCGIRKKLTTHTGRHTFATTVTLSNNISLEAVSEMLGHSSLQMTKRYARVVDDFLGREMDKLETKLKCPKLINQELLKNINSN